MLPQQCISRQEAWHMLPQQCIQRQKRERERERLGRESERERGLAYATAAVYKSARGLAYATAAVYTEAEERAVYKSATGLAYATAAVYTEAEERAREREAWSRAREREAWHMLPQQCASRHARMIAAQGSQPPKSLSTAQKALSRPKGSQPSIVQTVQTRVHIGMQSSIFFSHIFFFLLFVPQQWGHQTHWCPASHTIARWPRL